MLSLSLLLVATLVTPRTLCNRDLLISSNFVFSSISLREFFTSSLKVFIIFIKLHSKSFSSTSRLGWSSLPFVCPLDSRVTMLYFRMLEEFVHRHLPISSSNEASSVLASWSKFCCGCLLGLLSIGASCVTEFHGARRLLGPLSIGTNCVLGFHGACR